MELPKSFDLSDKFPEAYDQGRIGSCSANAIAGAIHYNIGRLEATPSRLYIYYNERLAANEVSIDSGSSLMTGLLATKLNGWVPETVWTYEPADHLFAKPSKELYDLSASYKVDGYSELENLEDIKSAIVNGDPVIIGMEVFESMESAAVAKSGILPMPASGEHSMGGHAVLVTGYDDIQGVATVRNSWGTAWGRDGYFLMPYDYLSNPEYVWEYWILSVKTSQGA
jgi:C1A family cysteine protease